MRDHNTIQLSVYITVHGRAGSRQQRNGCPDLHGCGVIYLIGNIYKIEVLMTEDATDDMRNKTNGSAQYAARPTRGPHPRSRIYAMKPC